MDYRWNILAWNKQTVEVFGNFNDVSENDRNVVWMMFCNDYYKSLFIDWEYHAKGVVKRFRSSYAKNIYDGWFDTFIGNLSGQSEVFTEIWKENSVDSMADVIKKLNHPDLGLLTYEFSRFYVLGNDKLMLILHTLI